MSDCPHQHLKDLGLEDLRAIVRDETGSGRKIVRFLTRAMDGELPGFQPHHELEAAKILANLDSEEAPSTSEATARADEDEYPTAADAPQTAP